jgi:phenylalanyl-tRNA synthetase alpha chain
MTNESIPNLTAYDDAALDQAFAALAKQAAERAASLDGPDAVEAFRREWLGRKQGRLNEVSGRWLKSAPPEAKRSIGQRFNELKKQVELLEQPRALVPVTPRLPPRPSTLRCPARAASPAPSTPSRAR